MMKWRAKGVRSLDDVGLLTSWPPRLRQADRGRRYFPWLSTRRAASQVQTPSLNLALGGVAAMMAL